jgi:hypothetical protein
VPDIKEDQVLIKTEWSAVNCRLVAAALPLLTEVVIDTYQRGSALPSCTYDTNMCYRRAL